MSACNYIQIVTPNTCLGDSLATFNSNFSALDEGLCRQPDITQGNGVGVQLHVTEQNHNVFEISTRNSFVYNTNFDYLSAATVQSIPIKDGTYINTTAVPYGSGALAAFNTIALTRSAPTVSIFWTASGSNNSTTYFTNSANLTNELNIGNYQLNGSITSFLSSGSYVYIGGDFTYPSRKLAIVNLNDGSEYSTLGKAGTIVGNPLSAEGGFGLVGTINSIVQWNDLIIFGGSYQSLKMGRGLTIYSTTTNKIYPFYVNGEVNALHVNGSDLYVGGHFDYVNYLAESASVISGLRRPTNGLSKISLTLVEAFPNSAISSIFGNNVAKSFDRNSVINSIASKSDNVYIGGNFTVYNGSELVAFNLGIINGDGTINLNWNPVIVGEVNTIAVNGNYLYVGGNIKSAYTMLQYFGAPRKLDVAYNLVGFNISTPDSPSYEYNWKPMINGPVNKICFHDNDVSTYVYCYGNFTNINGLDVGYIGAVNKPFNNNIDGQSPILWKNSLDKPPEKINNALIRAGKSILIGGGFETLNEKTRSKFGRISGVYDVESTEALKTVTWNVGAQLCGVGTNLGLNLTNTVSVTAYAGTYGSVNETTFPLNYTSSVFKNCSEGSLMRFFVRRTSLADTVVSPAYIIGWKVNFN